MRKKRGAAVLAALLLGASAVGSVPVSAVADSVQAAHTVHINDEYEIPVGSRFKELFFGNKKDKTKNPIAKDEQVMLCPGGDVFGVRLVKDGVSVVSAEEECILRGGDVIISIDGERIRSLGDIKRILSASDGKPMDLVIERGDERFSAEVIPKKTGESYKLGAVLRDGVAGIGTITYYNPKNGEFGGLGHGICEEKTGKPEKMKNGTVTGVLLGGVDKSKVGDPGELTGILTDKKLGEVYSNTDEGIFGKLEETPDKSRTPLPIAKRDEVKEGAAKIISTLKNGHRAEYDVEIFDINRSSRETKSFKIRVTDGALEAVTGGIVRGMSGSPIIQNGKLVGAVTHVMVADPTEGYGIFIENMLDAANTQVIPKAA